MKPSLRAAASLLLCAVVYLFAPIQGQAQETPSVRRVEVLSKQNPLEIEIEGSESLVPQAQILSDPDRLVVDFANAVPGAQLRNQTLNSQEIKSVRVGLFSSKPPVTRVVLDLNGPQAYQIFPSGRTVIIKIGSGRSQISRSCFFASRTGEYHLSRGIIGNHATPATTPAGGYIPVWAAHHYFQSGNTVGSSFRSASAHRSGNRHPSRSRAGKSSGRTRPRPRARSFVSPAERIQIQLPHLKFGQRSSLARSSDSQRASRRDRAGL